MTDLGIIIETLVVCYTILELAKTVKRDYTIPKNPDVR